VTTTKSSGGTRLGVWQEDPDKEPEPPDDRTTAVGEQKGSLSRLDTPDSRYNCMEGGDAMETEMMAACGLDCYACEISGRRPTLGCQVVTDWFKREGGWRRMKGWQGPGAQDDCCGCSGIGPPLSADCWILACVDEARADRCSRCPVFRASGWRLGHTECGTARAGAPEGIACDPWRSRAA